ncbi:hydrogenase maturation protease [Candidatus Dojkabacteria bacterium]|nr:hydrogenase maturation protease [Candidatus Dojkabacteria bacterium]
MKKILIYGIGNPSRQDDSLGPQFIEKFDIWISKQNFPLEIETTANYQLNIEDADLISQKDLVIFIDATKTDITNFEFSSLMPRQNISEYTTHSLNPEQILNLCQKLYKNYPETYMLQIKGYSWTLGEKISEKASRNLDDAVSYFKNWLNKLT